MSVKKYEAKSPFYHYDFRYKGRRFYRTTGEATLAVAKRVEVEARQRAIAEMAIEARESSVGNRSDGPMTLVAVVSRYWSEIGSRQVRSDQVLWSLNWLTAHFGEASLSPKSAVEISLMFAKRRGEKVDNVAVARGVKKDAKAGRRRERFTSPRQSQRNRAAAQGALFRSDTLRHHIQPIKWKYYLVKESAERIRVMKAEQETAILAALPEKYHSLVYVKKRIGPRIFELLKMRWCDIDRESRRVVIEGKGGSRATVPLPKDVRDVLWGLPRRGERVFTHEDGSPMTYSGLDSAWNRACAKAGVTELGLHALRHTAATNLLRMTNLKAVQKMLRHRDIRSTLRYAHADDADLLAALELLGVKNNHGEIYGVNVKPLKQKA